uniref:Uncharacterized protein n=1 Tax=Cuerna arida TaxID=1464854 RepID=A0A1B6EKL2_9HEMI
MKRRVIVNTRTPASVNKVLRPCLTHHKTKTQISTINKCTHVRSVQCHEETMSKLTSCYINDGFGGETDHCFCNSHTNCDRPRSRDRKRNNSKSKSLRSKSNDMTVYESTSAPLNGKDKEMYSKTCKSKSIPLVENPCNEDSVDFIPVKLSSTNDCRYKPKSKCIHKQNHDLKLEHRDEHNRNKTWDEILRGPCKILAESEKYKDILYKNGVDYINSSESCRNSQKKASKVSTSISTRTLEPSNEKLNHLCKDSSSNSIETYQASFDPFIDSDPVKTLDFLIKQLREKLVKKPENKNLQQIIIEMENALLKISAENQTNPLKIQDKAAHDTRGISSFIASKSSNDSELKEKISPSECAQLKDHYGESCLYLQSLCIKQRESCDNHLREKEQLTLQLAESRRLLNVAKSKEKEYEVTLGELRLKVQETETKNQQQSETIQELLDKITLLTSENEALVNFKESTKKLGSQLKQITIEKELLQSRLWLQDLEIEKLKVLLKVKDNKKTSLEQKKNELLEESIKNSPTYEECVDVPLEIKNNSFLSLSTMTSWSQDKPGLVCSSQASSSPRHSPSPYNSWQHISAIYQRPEAAKPITKEAAEKFLDLEKLVDQPDLDLENPSIANSLWSDKLEQDINSKMLFSDHESGTLSS